MWNQSYTCPNMTPAFHLSTVDLYMFQYWNSYSKIKMEANCCQNPKNQLIYPINTGAWRIDTFSGHWGSIFHLLKTTSVILHTLFTLPNKHMYSVGRSGFTITMMNKQWSMARNLEFSRPTMKASWTTGLIWSPLYWSKLNLGDTFCYFVSMTLSEIWSSHDRPAALHPSHHPWGRPSFTS